MPNDSSGAAVKLKRWQVSWILAMLSVAALPSAWYWWSLERLSAREFQQTLQREAVVAPLQARVTFRLANWKSAMANVTSVQERIRTMGESPDLWSRRTVTIDNQRMSRVEVERYLADLSSGQDRLLLPSSINVRAARPGESMFVAHQGQDSADALLVTVKAELFTRGAL